MSALAQNALRAHRRDLFWIAALIHRVSGVLLACFLPLHFLALALVLTGPARFDRFIAWTAQPVVQVAEALLVFLLTVHLLGGLRLLLIEYAAWKPGRRETIACALGTGLIVALAFYIGLR